MTRFSGSHRMRARSYAHSRTVANLELGLNGVIVRVHAYLSGRCQWERIPDMFMFFLTLMSFADTRPLTVTGSVGRWHPWRSAPVRRADNSILLWQSYRGLYSNIYALCTNVKMAPGHHHPSVTRIFDQHLLGVNTAPYDRILSFLTFRTQLCRF